MLFNGAVEVDTNSLTGLRLPSGDGRRFADFQMWFWLSAQPLVTLLPNTLTFFPDQLVGVPSAAMSATLANNSPNQITISSISLTGDTADFAIVNPPSAQVTVAAAGTYPISVTFTPTNTGARSATINVNESVDSAALGIQLTGNGITRPMTVLPTQLDFPSTQIGQTNPLTVALTSVSTTSLITIYDIVLSDNQNFTLTNPQSGYSGAIELLNITVVFNPQVAEVPSATLTITHNATSVNGVATSVNGGSVTNQALTIPLTGIVSTTAIVPDVRGLAQDEAETEIVKAGLSVGTVIKPPNFKGALPYTVSYTDPAANTKNVSLGTAVNIYMENQ